MDKHYSPFLSFLRYVGGKKTGHHVWYLPSHPTTSVLCSLVVFIPSFLCHGEFYLFIPFLTCFSSSINSTLWSRVLFHFAFLIFSSSSVFILAGYIVSFLFYNHFTCLRGSGSMVVWLRVGLPAHCVVAV